MAKINCYFLRRQWFDFAFENQGRINPSHGMMYFWFLELNNRMRWVRSFYSPASQTMAAIGLASYNTYKKVFDDLVAFGFITVVQESKNQYTACVIALSNFDKALDDTLDESTPISTGESTIQRTDSIIKHINIKPKNNKTAGTPPTLDQVLNFFELKQKPKNMAEAFYNHYAANGWVQNKGKPIVDWQAAARGWISREPNFKNPVSAAAAKQSFSLTEQAEIERQLKKKQASSDEIKRTITG